MCINWRLWCFDFLGLHVAWSVELQVREYGVGESIVRVGIKITCYM